MQEIRLLSKPDLEEIDAHLSEVLTNLLVDDIDIAESSSKDDRVLAMAGKVKRDYLVIRASTRTFVLHGSARSHDARGSASLLSQI